MSEEMTELQRLRLERAGLEKELQELKDRAKETARIAELKEELKKNGPKTGPRLLQGLKALTLEMEKAVHPERFGENGKRRKGKAGRR